MTRTNYADKNAAVVLEQVKAYIQMLQDHQQQGYDYKAPEGSLVRFIHRGYDSHAGWTFRISTVCEALSIFDWWNETLSVSQLKQMKKFLEQAIDLGFTGYVCFKVGAAGCSHGMWAHTEESSDGYSPKGDFLYHSFRAGENYFDMEIDGLTMKQMGAEGKYGYQFTLAQVKQALADRKEKQAKAEAEKQTLDKVLTLVSDIDEINIQEPAEEDTTGQVFTGKCSDFRAYSWTDKYLKCEVDQIRAYDGQIIILLNERGC